MHLNFYIIATFDFFSEQHKAQWQTIKATTERSRISPMKAIFWYNISPKTGQDGESMSHRAVIKYEW